MALTYDGFAAKCLNDDIDFDQHIQQCNEYIPAFLTILGLQFAMKLIIKPFEKASVQDFIIEERRKLPVATAVAIQAFALIQLVKDLMKRFRGSRNESFFLVTYYVYSNERNEPSGTLSASSYHVMQQSNRFSKTIHYKITKSLLKNTEELKS